SPGQGASKSVAANTTNRGENVFIFGRGRNGTRKRSNALDADDGSQIQSFPQICVAPLNPSIDFTSFWTLRLPSAPISILSIVHLRFASIPQSIQRRSTGS